jgi:Response regulators consisting of a CheY-like receiver domain and a winged-helix DNA-binding domain
MSKPHILIVDDNSASVSLLSILLSKKMDCELSVAYEGASAIKVARETKPDLILMDWQMPGIDGIRAIELLKQDSSTMDIPVIMITCFSTQEDLEKAFSTGAVDFIRKPFEQIELMSRVRSALQMHEYLKKMREAQKSEIVTMALKNVHNTEFRQKYYNMLKQIKTMHKEGSDGLEALIDKAISDLNTDFEDSSWSQIEQRIKESDPRFFKALGEKHPNLTPAEIKLCYFLRLNLSSKDIAKILFLSYDSVRISRTRLRKKLNLSNEDNLVVYLYSL